ncbi:uncharacterized protein N7459_001571 [Penicillium hispanicum]|uniref:uncharacterized protein n=1 Tax=Penicillium hispanicum TaxID=1080232 RepID=UPI0025400776|nr:uncharacterized protein N7459_001571 [Penicillium hispanicum]KAJ5595363.1 hypothetical protein N7459_001571 [Penicillium hispanicum]
MSLTAPPSGLPPSPPHSTEGEPIIDQAFEGCASYPPVPVWNAASSGFEYIKMHGDEFSTPEPQSMIYAAHHSYYQHPGDYSSSIPTSYPMAIPGPNVNTPPMTTDEDHLPSRLASSSPSFTSPSRPRVPTPKAKLSRSPRESRARSRRETSKAMREPHLQGPLSEVTKHMIDVPLKDMKTWVYRSVEERKREVNQKGKISRPMNSFMLYRSAYAERTKKLLSQSNHQVVSRAAGQSWAIEPKEVRDMYEELARIERDNHATSHPEYKFKPQKGPVALKRMGEMTPPSPITSGPVVDPGSPTDWEDSEYSLAPSSLHSRSQSFDVDYLSKSRSSTPFDGHDSVLGPGGYLGSSWNTSYPSQSLPTVQPSALHGLGSHVEDVHFRHASPLPHDISFGSSNGLAGLPGASHDDLLQPQPTHPMAGRMIGSGHMDPQLLSYEHDSTGLPVTTGAEFHPVSNPYPVWGDEVGGNCYLTTSAPSGTSSPAPYGHPQLGNIYVPGLQRNPSWDASQHDPNGINEGDWLDTQTPTTGY